jgi:hypothetical protein
MADVKVQSRFATTYTTAMTDSQTTADVAVAPANNTGYLTLRYGYADQEDIYFAGVSGLQLTGLLRGLSPTALTPTEVIGLKKTHVINAPTTLNTVKMMTVHYVINNKPNIDGAETISGAWTFSIAPNVPGLKSATGNQVLTITEETTPVNYLDIKASATGAAVKLTGTGANTDVSVEVLGKGTGVLIVPDKSVTKTAAAPTANAQLANKKYVDDQVGAAVAFAEATTTQVGTQVEVSGSNRLFINPKSTAKTHAIYTPAYLTGGNSAEALYSTWYFVINGSFRFTIDGVARNIDGINFTGVTSMNDVAAKIQAAIRVVTTGLEVVAWSTNHFVITSGLTTVSSAITELSTSTGTVGTDISGLGAANWMDGDVGNGTATAAVLDYTADVNKLPVLGADGKLSGTLLNIPSTITSDAAELNKLDGAAATVTAANLNTLTASASSDADALHTHPSLATLTTNGTTGRNTDNSGDQVISHGLGTTPKIIIFNCVGNTYVSSHGSVNSAMGNTSAYRNSAGSCSTGTNCIHALFGSDSQVATVTAWGATTFTLSWVKGNSGTPVYVNWTAFK